MKIPKRDALFSKIFIKRDTPSNFLGIGVSLLEIFFEKGASLLENFFENRASLLVVLWYVV